LLSISSKPDKGKYFKHQPVILLVYCNIDFIDQEKVMEFIKGKQKFQPCPDLPSTGRTTCFYSGKAENMFHKNSSG
jgi:hypothetical protein